MHANLRSRVTLNILHNIRPKSTLARNLTASDPALGDQDLFGTLSDSGSKTLELKSAEKQIPDDPDNYDVLEIDLAPRKNHYFYKYEITKYARQGGPGLRRALELFHEMKSTARLQPTIDNFSPLIYGCAKAGYTKRAFDLYQESIKYINKPSNSIVTCLINACAESPFPEYGLERLKWFLADVKVNYNKTLNEVQYNSAIKAYGKLGQLEEASKLVQEMLDNDVLPTIDTFNMLLIGCASNKQAGCTFALRVYKRIKMYEMKPNLITYTLLLRCIRDCDMGSPELIASTLDELPAVTSLKKRIEYQKKANLKNRKGKMKTSKDFAWAPLFSDVGESFADAVKEPNSTTSQLALRPYDHVHKNNDKVTPKSGCKSQKLSAQSSDNNFGLVSREETISEMLPNLLSDDHLNLLSRIKSIQFDKLKLGSDRLLLFGGLHGYLATMMEDGIKPNYKTFSLILECLEPSRENHLAYHKLAKEVNITRDLVYYDLLIRKVSRNLRDRGRLELALYFVEQMHLDELRPNISTFEALSRACNTWAQAEKLIIDIEKCGFVVSDDLILNFFKCAVAIRNFKYLTNLIEYSKRKQYQPSRQLVDQLENLRLITNERIRKQEIAFRNSEAVPDRKEYDDERVKDFDEFRSELGRWLARVELKEEVHPWMQFNAEQGSRKRGFKDYVEQMKAADAIKLEALKTGKEFGNLFYKAKKSIAAQS